ncbi:MAG: hypothetical protein ABR564_09250 [Candidatus Dormibacteria bacterium]
MWVNVGTPWAAVLIGALAIRLALAPFHGFFADLQAYVDWGNLVRHHPLDPYSAGADAYRQGRLVFPPNYPPLTLDAYAFLTQIHVWLAAGGAAQPSALSVRASPGLAALMKLPSLVSDLSCATALLVIGRRVATPRRALLVAALCALSPVLMVDGALWGQTDGVGAGLVLVALLCALRGHGASAGLAGAAAVMLKPQPLVFLPLITVYLWRRWGRPELGRAAAAGAATVLAVWLPYLAGHAGEVTAFAGNLSTVVDAYPQASLNAFNLWWLLGLADVQHAAPHLAGLSIDLVGTLIVGATVAAVCLSTARDPTEGRLLLGAALIAAVFFVAGSLQHERYLLPCVPLLAAAALYNPSHLWWFALSSATTLLNMLLVALPPVSPGERLSRLDWLYEPHSTVARLVAATNVALALILAQRFLSTRGRAPALRVK